MKRKDKLIAFIGAPVSLVGRDKKFSPSGGVSPFVSRLCALHQYQPKTIRDYVCRAQKMVQSCEDSSLFVGPLTLRADPPFLAGTKRLKDDAVWRHVRREWEDQISTEDDTHIQLGETLRTKQQAILGDLEKCKEALIGATNLCDETKEALVNAEKEKMAAFNAFNATKDALQKVNSAIDIWLQYSEMLLSLQKG